MNAEQRLIEYAKSLHRDPWNYWPPVSVLGRIKDEGAGASQSTDGDRDAALVAMLMNPDVAEGMERDRRCAEVREACYRMPYKLALIVDATYRGWPSAKDPRSWKSAVEQSGLSQATYFRRKKEMLVWLADYLCISEGVDKAA